MNLFGPACPACGGEPISLWRKLVSRPGRSFACQSCGTPLRLGMPGFRQFLLPAFVGTLASFAPDILAGVGIFILDEITQVAIFLFANRHLEAQRPLAHPHDMLDFAR